MKNRRPPRGLTMAERLDRLSDPEPNSGCILWLGSISKRTGYGSITVKEPGRPTKPVHRVAYETFVGPIPDGLTIDHLCRNQVCINVRHMEPVTRRENILRSRGLTESSLLPCNSRNPGEDSPDAGQVMVSFRIPRWLKDEISTIAERRLSDSSAMFREALLAWLPSQRDKVA